MRSGGHFQFSYVVTKFLFELMTPIDQAVGDVVVVVVCTEWRIDPVPLCHMSWLSEL